MCPDRESSTSLIDAAFIRLTSHNDERTERTGNIKFEPHQIARKERRAMPKRKRKKDGRSKKEVKYKGVKLEEHADQVRKENECANQAAGKKIEVEMSVLLNTCTPASTALYNNLISQNENDDKFVEWLRKMRDEKIYSPHEKVLLHKRSSGVQKAYKQRCRQMNWKQISFSTRCPINEDSKKKFEQEFKRAHDTNEIPQMFVNNQLTVQAATGGVLKGELQSIARCLIPKGTLIPWPCEIFLKEERKDHQISLYEREFRDFVILPDLRSAAPYTNDFAGPYPKRTQNKMDHAVSRYNIKMVEVFDGYGMPYPCFITLRDINKGEICWYE